MQGLSFHRALYRVTALIRHVAGSCLIFTSQLKWQPDYLPLLKRFLCYCFLYTYYNLQCLSLFTFFCPFWSIILFRAEIHFALDFTRVPAVPPKRLGIPVARWVSKQVLWLPVFHRIGYEEEVAGIAACFPNKFILLEYYMEGNCRSVQPVTHSPKLKFKEPEILSLCFPGLLLSGESQAGSLC